MILPLKNTKVNSNKITLLDTGYIFGVMVENMKDIESFKTELDQSLVKTQFFVKESKNEYSTIIKTT